MGGGCVEGRSQTHLQALLGLPPARNTSTCVFAVGMFDIENMLTCKQAETIKDSLKDAGSLTSSPSGVCVFACV